MIGSLLVTLLLASGPALGLEPGLVLGNEMRGEATSPVLGCAAWYPLGRWAGAGVEYRHLFLEPDPPVGGLSLMGDRIAAVLMGRLDVRRVELRASGMAGWSWRRAAYGPRRAVEDHPWLGVSVGGATNVAPAWAVFVRLTVAWSLNTFGGHNEWLPTMGVEWRPRWKPSKASTAGDPA